MWGIPGLKRHPNVPTSSSPCLQLWRTGVQAKATPMSTRMRRDRLVVTTGDFMFLLMRCTKEQLMMGCVDSKQLSHKKKGLRLLAVDFSLSPS